MGIEIFSEIWHSSQEGATSGLGSVTSRFGVLHLGWSLVWDTLVLAVHCPVFGSESVILCIHIPRQGSVHTSFRTYLFSRCGFIMQLVGKTFCGIGILSASYEIYEHCEHKSPE